MSRISEFKSNPANIQRAIFDVLDEVTSGEIDIVDPTNPFVFLLEASSVNTALAIAENKISLRKQYPSLSQTESELYRHMSDTDYLNRFATPSTASFTFTMQINEIESKLVYDSVNKLYKGTIARDTTVTVDGVTFSLVFPIDIIKYSNGVIQVKYQTDIDSPLQVLTTNVIEYNTRTDDASITWLFFTVPLQQFAVTTTYYPLHASATFNQDVIFEDEYYYTRIWSRDTVTDLWTELKTTHSEQVYDIHEATAVLKVTDNVLNVTIPAIYSNSGLTTGNVRIDVYTTKGAISLNLSNYKLDSFSTKFKAIDEERDLSIYTSAIDGLSIFSYSASIVNSGSNGLTFTELRDRIITNSIGSNNLPVTNIQLGAYITDKGFGLVKNVDTVSNRIFLATKRLPSPSNSKLVTSANIGINTFIAGSTLNTGYSKVVSNNSQQTILSENLFVSENGILRLLDDSELNTLMGSNKTSMVSQGNTNDYLYNPFYYVLDSSSNEFEVRAYNLDQPYLTGLNFKSQNETLQLIVNTGSYLIEKVSNGYLVTIVSKSGKFYKQLNDSEVGLQIAYTPVGENTLAYINADQVFINGDGERVYQALIEINYEIDTNDSMTVVNTRMFDNTIIDTKIDLLSTLHVFYVTTSVTNVFLADSSDSLIGKFMLPAGSVSITHEELTLSLGTSLKNLWRRSRLLPTGLGYDTYTADEPLLYTKAVYDIDPVTNSIFTVDGTGALVYNVLHNIGDPVLDSSGNPVYKHRVGDPIIDVNGNPVVSTALDSTRELDMLLVDGRYLLADESNYTAYRSEITRTIDNWITIDLLDAQDILLEQTKLYFWPINNLGLIEVYPDNGNSILLPSEQSFTVDLYVTNAIFTDKEARDNLNLLTVSTINDYVSNNSIVNMTELTGMLKDLYGLSIVSFELTGLGGDASYSIVKAKSNKDNLSLKKKLVLQQDNSIILTEDVTINYHDLTR